MEQFVSICVNTVNSEEIYLGSINLSGFKGSHGWVQAQVI
jgi:hypothetical protein